MNDLERLFRKLAASAPAIHLHLTEDQDARPAIKRLQDSGYAVNVHINGTESPAIEYLVEEHEARVKKIWEEIEARKSPAS